MAEPAPARSRGAGNGASVSCGGAMSFGDDLDRQRARVMRAVRQAGAGWAEAMRAHTLAPPGSRLCRRLAALARAAEDEQVAWEHAHAAGLLWRPVPGAEQAEPPYELRPGTGRRGPAELWERFDGAVASLNRAITGSDAATVADAFRGHGGGREQAGGGGRRGGRGGELATPVTRSGSLACAGRCIAHGRHDGAVGSRLRCRPCRDARSICRRREPSGRWSSARDHSARPWRCCWLAAGCAPRCRPGPPSRPRSWTDQRENQAYLDGVELPRELRMEHAEAGLARADYVFLGVPSSGLDEVIDGLEAPRAAGQGRGGFAGQGTRPSRRDPADAAAHPALRSEPHRLRGRTRARAGDGQRRRRVGRRLHRGVAGHGAGRRVHPRRRGLRGVQRSHRGGAGRGGQECRRAGLRRHRVPGAQRRRRRCRTHLRRGLAVGGGAGGPARVADRTRPAPATSWPPRWLRRAATGGPASCSPRGLPRARSRLGSVRRWRRWRRCRCSPGRWTAPGCRPRSPGPLRSDLRSSCP